jgi:protein arginine kinase activator
MIKNMHKGPEHVGKTPASLLRSRQLDARIKHLQTSLERAVADEEYEKAADLRDQIRRIEGNQRV